MKFENINKNSNKEIEAIKQILIDKKIATDQEISDKVSEISTASALKMRGVKI